MYKIEAEKAIIHILMHNPELIVEISNQVTPDYFCFETDKPRTGTTYKGILAAITAGAKELTPAIVANFSGLGADYIRRFYDLEGVAVANLEAYLGQITDAYANRVVQTELANITNKQYTGTELQVKLGDLNQRVLMAAPNDVQSGRGDAVIARYRNKLYAERAVPLSERVVKTPLTAFNDLIGGLYRQTLHIVAARPGMGKTALAQLFTDYAINNGKKAAYFILETTDNALTERYVSQRTGITMRDLAEQTYVGDPKKEAQVEAALNDLADPKRYTYGSEYRNFEKLVSLIYQLKAIEGDDLYLVVIDFFQLLNTTKSFHSDATALSYMVQVLDALCGQLNLHILLLSQLNRENESAGDKRPLLHNLKSTGGLEESGHLVGFLYRDAYYNPDDEDGELSNVAELIYRKNRNGKIGTVKLYWDGATMTYKNLHKDYLESSCQHMF